MKKKTKKTEQYTVEIDINELFKLVGVPKNIKRMYVEYTTDYKFQASMTVHNYPLGRIRFIFNSDI